MEDVQRFSWTCKYNFYASKYRIDRPWISSISALPLMAQSDFIAWRTTGVSRHFDVNFLVAIPLGAKLRY